MRLGLASKSEAEEDVGRRLVDLLERYSLARWTFTDRVGLDEQQRVGDNWRRHYGSLRLYSPARLDGLPGLAFPAPAFSFPTKDEMADYLEGYARAFELPVRGDTRVERVSRNGSGYVVDCGERRLEAKNVVVATGTFGRPFTPGLPRPLAQRAT